MISNNGADIFRYWGEAHVSGSADSGTCSSGMERLFAFPLLSVKEKTDLERAGLDRYKKRGREREISGREAKMKSIGIPNPDPAIFSSSFSKRIFLLHSYQSSQGLIYLPIDRSISRCRTRIYTYLYIHIGRIVWDGNSIRMEGKPGAELPGSRGAL